MESVSLRPMHDEDLGFLERLYASTREEELAPLDWTPDQKRAFLASQFEAQHRYYVEQFRDAAFDVIERGGRAIGRLYVDRRDDELRIIDIALLPEARGSGIGSALLGELLEEASQRGVAVRIHVERNNPALRLYERLGFVPVEDQGVYWLMERPAPAQLKTAS